MKQLLVTPEPAQVLGNLAIKGRSTAGARMLRHCLHDLASEAIHINRLPTGYVDARNVAAVAENPAEPVALSRDQATQDLVALRRMRPG